VLHSLPGDGILELLGRASSQVIIAAPYIKVAALTRLLSAMSHESVSLICVTRWRPEDIADGVCDIAIYGPQKDTTRYELTAEPIEGERALALRQEWFTWAYDQPFTEELRRRYAQQIRSRTGFGVGGGNSGMMFFFKDSYTGKIELAAITAVDAGTRRTGRASWFRSVALSPELRELPEKPADAEPLPQVALTYEQLGEPAEAIQPPVRARA
jgi:hypothetical protein